MGLAALLLWGVAASSAEPKPRIAATDIAGTVTSAHGAEAGVWVIAETHDFQTRFAKIVVTDEAGRYLIPELPQAKYRVWVRGYGLIDSPGADATPGQHLDIAATIAPDAATAAKIYPAAYWYAMMKIPEEAQVAKVPGGRNGYLMWMKNMGCVGCHQLGNLATRTIPKSLGTFKTSEEAWLRRMQSGQAGVSDDQHRARRAGGRSDSISRGLDRSHRRRRTSRGAARRVRAASSATSSPRCAIGRTAKPICTTCREPIAAIQRSMAMACCTALRS